MSDSATSSMVTGLFDDRASAEQAFRCATELGYQSTDINVLMSSETRERDFAEPQQSALSERAAAEAPEHSKAAKELGGPTGGTIATAAPVVAAIGTALLIPGIGLAVAGPVAVALTAATAVGVAGGLIGALTHWGVPRPRVKEYEHGIRSGGILLGVKPRSAEDCERLMQCWQTNGGRLVHS